MFAENDAGRKLEWQPFTIWLEVEVNIHIFLRLHLVSPQQNIDERILKSGEVVVLILIKRYNGYQKSSPQVTSLENGQTSFTYPGTRGWYFSHNFIWSVSTVKILVNDNFQGEWWSSSPFDCSLPPRRDQAERSHAGVTLKVFTLKALRFIPFIPTLGWAF